MMNGESKKCIGCGAEYAHAGFPGTAMIPELKIKGQTVIEIMSFSTVAAEFCSRECRDHHAPRAVSERKKMQVAVLPQIGLQ